MTEHRRITGKIVIATHNPGKLAEMRELLAPHGVEAIPAGALGLPEPEESGDTFRANAISARNSSCENGVFSAVPWTSIMRPSPVMTKLASVSASESSA